VNYSWLPYSSRKELVKIFWRLWVDGLAGLVDANGGLARTCVSSTEELTKVSSLT